MQREGFLKYQVSQVKREYLACIMPYTARLYLGKSCCMFTYWINLFKLRQNTMPLDITKLFVLLLANLFYHWNLWWSSVIHHCRKIEISSFNVYFALAVILSDIVGALIVRLDGSFFPLEKLHSDCRNKYNGMFSSERNKMYIADFEPISVQKGH